LVYDDVWVFGFGFGFGAAASCCCDGCSRSFVFEMCNNIYLKCDMKTALKFQRMQALSYVS
jgi:hypothetical protein